MSNKQRREQIRQQEMEAARRGFARTTASVLILIVILFFFTYLLPNVFGIDLSKLGSNDTVFGWFMVVSGILIALSPFLIFGAALRTYCKNGGTVEKAFANARKNMTRQQMLSVVFMVIAGIAIVIFAVVEKF